MRIRQSDLKTWQDCALRWRYANLDGLPREQSGALTYGSLIHEAVLLLETTRDLDQALTWFKQAWLDPTSVSAEYEIHYFNRGSNWKKYQEQGEKTLRDWWSLIQWDTDVVLGREYSFDVPIGAGHTLHGTIDKLALRYRGKTDEYVLLVSDYKTNSKVPTYEYLEDDLQFTAYAYATWQPEFWTGIENGQEMHERLISHRRFGEWVSLTANKRLDAGERTQQQFNRLIYACNQFADAVAMRIFVPTISGATCRFCEFRKNCGLQEIPEDAPTTFHFADAN